MKKYLSRVLLAVVLSGPIAGFILAFFDSVFIHYYFFGEDYSFYQIDVLYIATITYAAFFYLFYLIFGLITTFITDIIVSLFSTDIKVLEYYISFITYTLAGILLWFSFKITEPSFLWYIFIPIFTYLITLILIRNNSKSFSIVNKDA